MPFGRRRAAKGLPKNHLIRSRRGFLSLRLATPFRSDQFPPDKGQSESLTKDCRSFAPGPP
jgi:hypothetical protein